MLEWYYSEPYQMFSPDSRAFYTVSAILFLLPWSLLFFSWLAFNRAQVGVPLPSWRRYLVYAVLLAASVSTALNMVWNASWLRHGVVRTVWERDLVFGNTLPPLQS